ncbi:Clp protease N-terminal domain-containing protein [Actinospica robiniae]|uniref:Clp protease N-terminal domain-containing protein n=1 Tax=Actinospica robiniae TaxID=304901 RepID=UPI00040C72E5|nr:Clp protease N-terminal domain-containing protein [Actinospica robiniae]
MYDRFTSHAKRAIVDAQEHARALGHGHIGSEHLLLGLLPVHPCAATQVLSALAIPPETLRSRLLEMLEKGAQAPSGHMPFTPAAKKALELSLRGAIAMHVDYVGTEHLLLGVAREGSGAAGRALAELGVEPDALERQVAALDAGAPEPNTRNASPGPLRGFLTDPDPA